jgi:uncharacterized DUF497 family protein
MSDDTVVERLLWDPGNVRHIARHQVVPAEVEELCLGSYILRVAYQGRILLIGPTFAGRMLAAVLERVRGGTYRVVTARTARRKERRLYESQTGVSNGER